MSNHELEELVAYYEGFDYDLQKHKEELSGKVTKKTLQKQEEILDLLNEAFRRENLISEEKAREITEEIEAFVKYNPRLNTHLKQKKNIEKIKIGDVVIAFTEKKMRPVMVVECKEDGVRVLRLETYDLKKRKKIKEETRVYYTGNELSWKAKTLKADGFIDCMIENIEFIPFEYIVRYLSPMRPEIQTVKFQEAIMKIDIQNEMKINEMSELKRKNAELEEKLKNEHEEMLKWRNRYRNLYSSQLL